MNEKTQKCVDDCNKCSKLCEETIEHCKKMGGKHAEPKHISLMRDCAEICKMSESFMLRDSARMQHICQECAEICEECAKSCEEIDPEDAQMMECAKMCRECADSCKEMS